MHIPEVLGVHIFIVFLQILVKLTLYNFFFFKFFLLQNSFIELQLVGKFFNFKGFSELDSVRQAVLIFDDVILDLNLTLHVIFDSLYIFVILLNSLC